MNFRLTAILLGSILAVGVVLLVLTFSGEGEGVPGDVLMEELAALKPSDKRPRVHMVNFDRWQEPPQPPAPPEASKHQR